MRWLIVEDALQDRKGHWYEYVRTFREGLLKLGDNVTILASQNAERFILNELDAKPVLPESIWHSLALQKSAWKRYLMIPKHAFKTLFSVRSQISEGSCYDIIFVPTVSVHHLLCWILLIKLRLIKNHTRLLLYFLSLPIKSSYNDQIHWSASPTSKLMKWLFLSLRKESASGQVILGVETIALKNAMESLLDMPFIYLPQPVELICAKESTKNNAPLFACYGAARHEKGSNLLQSAIALYLKRNPHTKVNFSIQWIDDFKDDHENHIIKLPSLLQDQRVEYITEYFKGNEYAERLSQTKILLLPYRTSSYKLRGSRVVIEAMINGIPVVTTEGTTLAKQAEHYGSAILCKDGDVESLVNAIHQMEQNYLKLINLAESRKLSARDHFSVKEFRRMLLS